MTVPSLQTLLSPPSATDIETQILTTLASLGFPVTDWEADGVALQLIRSISVAMAAEQQIATNIAAGGFLDTAAALRNSDGTDDSSWITLLAENLYAVTPLPASYAEGPVLLTNSQPFNTSIPAYGARFSNSKGATYTSTNAAAVTVPASGTLTITVRADAAGANGSAILGELVMLNAITGISGTNTTDLVAQNAESNASIAARCRAKLGALSPNGADASYEYFGPLADDGNGSLGVTRVIVDAPLGYGAVTVYAQNASGTLTLAQADDLRDYYYANCVPDSVICSVAPATMASPNVVATVYTRDATLTGADCEAALAEYVATLPIGGIDVAGVQVFPQSGLIATLQAQSQVLAVEMATPTGDLAAYSGSVPLCLKLGAGTTITVVVVS
jgi:hypothetical protein